MAKKSCGTRLVYRYATPDEPGFRARWWLPAAGPHVDPATWTGPADPTSGFPLPTAAAPDFEVINNSINVNDSSSGAGAARYGFIDGWFYLEEDCLVQDANANTGELGMVLLGECCGGQLTEAPGGNHDTSTDGADRTLMDPTPLSAGWHYLANPSSDSGAFHGLQLQCSTDGGTTWTNVSRRQPTAPVVESQEIQTCEPVPDGWSLDKPSGCCQPKFSTGGEQGPPGEQGEQGIQGIPGTQGPPGPVTPQEICTGDFVDNTGRAGWLHTWTPTYNANSGTVVENWAQVSTAEVSPDCPTDISVNVTLGNSYMQLRNMYGRAWYDVRLLINGTPVSTYTFQNYHYEDDLSGTNLDDDITPLGSAHFARASVAAGSTITVEINRRHNFVAGNAAIAAPFGRVISGLRAHFNVHYSPTQIVTGRL